MRLKPVLDGGDWLGVWLVKGRSRLAVGQEGVAAGMVGLFGLGIQAGMAHGLVAGWRDMLQIPPQELRHRQCLNLCTLACPGRRVIRPQRKLTVP